jgi:protein-disulfide isomerase
MLKLRYAVGASLSLLVLAACGGASSKAEVKSQTAAVAQAAGSDIAPTDMVMGENAALVTIVEYASVTCPHCATFHSEVLPTIIEKYVDAGKAKFVFREFPTPPAMLSVAGSLVARCAAEKGGPDAYFAVIGALMKTQDVWIQGADPKLELQKVAGQAGMDGAGFEACIKRQDLLDRINAGVAEADSKYNVNSTPTFFINGERLPPEQRTLEAFSKALDEAIAKAGG